MRIDRDKFLDMLDTLAMRGLIAEPESYSGRAMYGKQCIAVLDDSVSEWGLAIYLAHIAGDFDLDILDLPEPHTDSMGRGVVMYWPSFDWPADRECPSSREDEQED